MSIIPVYNLCNTPVFCDAVTFAVPESTDLSAHHMSDVNEKLRMALLNMQQEMKSLDKRLALVEQITVNQRKRQIDQENSLMVSLQLYCTLM